MNKSLKQNMIFGLLTLNSLIVIVPVIIIFAIVIAHGASRVDAEFLTQYPRMGMREGGIFPAIFGTIALTGTAIIIALPLGVISAVFLTEYTSDTLVARVVRMSITNLAGVPSIVFGLFGLGFFVLLMKLGASLIAGALTLVLLILPTIITTSEEALRSVPQSFREASLALGATKFQTIVKVILPAALPGMLTGAIFGISRAAGETAPILFTAAAFYLPNLPKSFMDQVMALPYHLYIISTQVPNTPDSVKYGTALVLLSIVFLMNLSAIILRNRLRRSRKW